MPAASRFLFLLSFFHRLSQYAIHWVAMSYVQPPAQTEVAYLAVYQGRYG